MTQDDPVTAYANMVIAGEIVAGPLVRLACQRHLRDLTSGPGRGLLWDLDAAKWVLEFFEKVLKLNGGDFEGMPFVLMPWQKFIIGSIFGWKKRDYKTGSLVRRFRKSYTEIGKGNGKSPMAGGIGIFMLVADDFPGSEVYAAASKKDQAMILFRDAVKMFRMSPALSSKLTASGGKGNEWRLSYLANGSWFRPISSDSGQSGPRVHCALLDEIHEHKTAEVINMMRAGTKGDPNAHIFEITNSGYDRTSICWEEHEYSRRILEQDPAILEEDSDSWFAYVCGLDEGDEPFDDDSCWIKANPNLGVSITASYIREEVAEAKGMPSKEGSVRRLNFCQWTDAENSWISADVWKPVLSDLNLDDYAGRECYGGLDLSSKRDLTALTLVFPMPDDEFHSFSWYWTPGDTLQIRAKESKAPLDVWRDKGFLNAPPGSAINYEFVAKQIFDLSEDFNIQELAFDPHKIDFLIAELDEFECEVKLVEHAQGFRKQADSQLWMQESIEQFETAISDGKIKVQKNPVTTWCVANAIIEKDASENQKFNKRKSMGRIDGAVSNAMAIGLASKKHAPEETSVYEERGIRYV